MSDQFQKLASAVEDHLLSMKARGVRYVTVAPETLADLQRPAPRAAFAPPVATPVAAPRVAPAIVKVSTPAPVIQAPAARTVFSAPKVLSPDAKETAMAELRARALACQKCPSLVASRKNVVFGVGNIHSQLMFVGEAPGADEDEQGEPFV
ncbi:MAG: phage polymerase-related protein, partial [Verrucomicrobiales bacterium]|nr:phage polymerase-related protein [Verrucomicrobiales bacterium]